MGSIYGRGLHDGRQYPARHVSVVDADVLAQRP